MALAVFLFFLYASPLFAAPAVDVHKDICRVVQEAVRSGMDEESVVTSSIELGHSVCLVVRCAIIAGGDTAKVIKGAMAAGSTVDVVSRCAVSAGAEPQKVAEAIDLAGAGPSLCYTNPEEGEGDDVFVGSIYEPPVDSISPSSF